MTKTKKLGAVILLLLFAFEAVFFTARLLPAADVSAESAAVALAESDDDGTKNVLTPGIEEIKPITVREWIQQNGTTVIVTAAVTAGIIISVQQLKKKRR